MAKGKVFPDSIFLARGRDGKGHFYSEDPMTVRDRQSIEIDFPKAMFDFFGYSDVVNPIELHVAGLMKVRGEAFDISMPAKIRSGEAAKHFEDLEGDFVEVLQMRSPDPMFPVNGIVMDRDGRLIGQRLFNVEGECKDGDGLHRLMTVSGSLVQEKKDDAVEASSSGGAADGVTDL